MWIDLILFINQMHFLQDVLLEVQENFLSSQLPMLVREMVNAVIEKSSKARESISKLLSYLILKKAITLNDFRDG